MNVNGFTQNTQSTRTHTGYNGNTAANSGSAAGSAAADTHDVAATLELSGLDPAKKLPNAGEGALANVTREMLEKMKADAQAARAQSAETAPPKTPINISAPDAFATQATYTAPATAALPAPRISDTVSFVHQKNEQEPAYVLAYDVYENTSLRNIHDVANLVPPTGERDAYYHKLFKADVDAVNKVAADGFWGPTLSYISEGSIESNSVRYAELRDEVFRSFGHDADLLTKNLESLDRAFGWQLQDVARETATMMKHEQQVAQAALRSDSAHSESYGLATHQDFDSDKFETHAREMMAAFSRSFLQQMQDGAERAVAFQNVLDMMLSTFSKTESVNALSFVDFMLLQKSVNDQIIGRAGT